MKKISKAIDLTGQVFDQLKVLNRVENSTDGKAQWLCQCSCGKKRIVVGKFLRKGQTKTCAECSHKLRHYKDLTGQRFGRLICIEPTEQRRGSSIVWKCKCDCGITTYKASAELVQGRTKSCGCLQEELRHKPKINIQVNERFGKLTVLEATDERNYKGILWRCKCDCGNYRLASGYSLTLGRVQSCGCLNSITNIQIAKILQELNIAFIQEYRFPDCRDKKPLAFDFYLPEHKICIEYDGEQHNQIIKYWGGKLGLKNRQHKDNIKNEYCLKHNIRLIRISYLDKEKININYLQNLINVENKQ